MKIVLFLSLILSFNSIDNSSFLTSNIENWMSTNLSTTTFRNGDEILHAKTKKEWEEAFSNKTPAYCYYENDEKHGKSYGILYNFYAVNDKRGLAPKGWHVATDKEWSSLIDELGGNLKAGKELLNGVFQFKPGGFRDIDGSFYDEGRSALYWTATVDFSFMSYNRQLFSSEELEISRGSSHHAMGMYVRCVKD